MKSDHQDVTSCLIAVGSNLASQAGSVQQNIVVALELLARESLTVVAMSRLFRTPAFPPGSGPEFINAALSVATTLSPVEVLDCLHRVEAALGRVRRQRWEARVIDLDLLSYGDKVLPDAAVVRRWIMLGTEMAAKEVPDRLILPHPRLHERGFVLVPLMDIAPDWQHPLLGKTVREFHAALSESDHRGIVPIATL